MAVLRGRVLGIPLGMQLSADRGIESVPEIVPHEPQVHLLVRHVRPRRMA